MCAGRCCALSASRRRSALSRHSVGSLLYVSELWAGEMLRSAGCSSGRSVCARGGRSARRCGSLAAFCVRVTPAVCRMSAKQDGLRYVSFLFRRGSGPPVVRSQRPSDYRTQLVHFGIVRFFAAIPTENKRTKKLRRIGERSRRRGVGTFLRKHIGLAMLSAGSPLGATRPQTCAKEPLALWTLVI